jgi:cardiolipin synthase
MQRGVRLRIITPGRHMDRQVVRLSSRGEWGELLAAGALMHEYQPTMYHCKMMIVDSLLVSVGSTNFDTRSFKLNDEANLNVFDARFAREQTVNFENDLRQSRQITLDEWEHRPLRQKSVEYLAAQAAALM